MKKFLLFSLFSLLFSLGLASASPSPVVQVISYKEPLGMYFSLQWWGSGTVIDTLGHILTNNHVVDNGLGGISDDFSVCLTEDAALPPKCHYTASVVARDPEKDIALLQIDSNDIFGNPVNYSSFSALPLDYTYVPITWDPVLARGYPWVWANTITETQGIVSGTYDYNGNTYIKTDTLIAWGNSGGPLIRNSRLVWVNTFLIGGFSDPALGYSLSIREAQNFLQINSTKTTRIQKNSPKFSPFLQFVNESTQKKQLTDKLITINFPQKYNITTYIPGSYIDGQISEESSTAVYSFSFLHFTTPKLTTPEEIRYFLEGQSFFPFWQDVKFRTVTLWGQTFYEVDSLWNTGGDKTKTQYIYFKIVNERNLLLLQLNTPFSNETTYDAIQKNILEFLAGISFPGEFSFWSTKPIDVVDAGISVKSADSSLLDFRSNFFPYNGAISQLMVTYDDIFSLRTYLGNLWSYAQISIVPNTFYTENTSASELLMKLNEDSYFSESTESRLITYKGYEWFMACSSDHQWPSSVTDEKKSTHYTATCEAILIVGKDDSHFLSLIFLIDKNQKSSLFSQMIQYLDTHIDIDVLGETDFGESTPKSLYIDVAKQSKEFQVALQLLVRYGILSARQTFDGNHPLTWDEYSRLHIWSIYHKRLTDHSVPGDGASPTFESVLSQLPIDRSAFVNSNQRDTFELMLRMQLAGVTLPTYSEGSLNQFRVHKDTLYRGEWQKIEDFEYLYFLGEKKAPNGSNYFNSGYYTPDEYVSYSPQSGLSYEPSYSSSPLRFWIVEHSKKTQKFLEEELSCTRTSQKYFSQYCFQKRQEYIWWTLSYPVLTKGEALNNIIPSIDFALWDEALAKKKKVTIEKESKGV